MLVSPSCGRLSCGQTLARKWSKKANKHSGLHTRLGHHPVTLCLNNDPLNELWLLKNFVTFWWAIKNHCLHNCCEVLAILFVDSPYAKAPSLTVDTFPRSYRGEIMAYSLPTNNEHSSTKCSGSREVLTMMRWHWKILIISITLASFHRMIMCFWIKQPTIYTDAYCWLSSPV